MSPNALHPPPTTEPPSKIELPGPAINIQQPTPHADDSPNLGTGVLPTETLAAPNQSTPLANVPASGTDVLTERLERVKDEKEEQERRESSGLPAIIGRSRPALTSNASQSIASVLHSATSVPQSTDTEMEDRTPVPLLESSTVHDVVHPELPDAVSPVEVSSDVTPLDTTLAQIQREEDAGNEGGSEPSSGGTF